MTMVESVVCGRGGAECGSWGGRRYEWNGGERNQVGEGIDEVAKSYKTGTVSRSRGGSGVAIGADFDDGNGNASGHVRLYQWNGAAWTQLGEDIDGEALLDISGYIVSLSSDVTIVASVAFGDCGAGVYSVPFSL